jgi:hypothetical protein
MAELLLVHDQDLPDVKTIATRLKSHRPRFCDAGYTVRKRTIASPAAIPLMCAALTCVAMLPSPAHAHAIAGDRVFPSTMAIDDPGVGDEANLQFGHVRVPGDDGDQSKRKYQRTAQLMTTAGKR